jgi:TonB-linked SusC/RagA family outer membrane protein
MKKFLFGLCCLLALLISRPVEAQNTKIVTGVVTDKQGSLPGVSVYEKDNTPNGTKTDDNGRFTLKLTSASKILVFSYLGYLPKQIDVSGKSKLDITLEEDIKGLDEVVIVGYGTTKKITATGAVSSISGAEIRQSPTASLQNALVGRLPGFFSEQRSGQPGKDGASFQIRGISTYQGSTTPLIIVDDIEVTSDQVNALDPNEIENLSILKDASTTAVYGVRGANGVIVIKTRRGEAGKPQITVRNETGILSPTRPPEINDGYTTLNLLKEQVAELGLDPAVQYPQFFAGNNLNHYLTNDDPYNHPFVNWWDVLLKKYSIQNRTNFDISGGTQKAKYFISLGALSQGGIYKDFSEGTGYNTNYNYNRYNFRSNLDLNPNEGLHIRLDLSGRFQTTNEPYDTNWNNGGTTFQYLWNGELSGFNYPVYNADGSLGGSVLSNTKPNPVANLRYSGYTRTFGNNIGVVTQADQKLNFVTTGLSAKALISYASDNGFVTAMHRVGTDIPTFYYDATSGGYKPVTTNLYRLGPIVRSGYSTGVSRLLNLQASLNYSRQFGGNNVTALAMVNQTSNTTDTYSSGIIAGEPYHVQGLVGRVTYNYKQKYLFEVSAGYNGSDKFVSSKQYQLFPAVSAGWNISEEPFFKNNITFVDGLKLRGSYGLEGNDGIGSSVYSYDKTYVSGSGKSYYFGQTPVSYTGLIEPTLANHDITWESQTDLDLGLDLKMFKGSLAITADYFHKRRSDILTTRGSVAAAFGAALPLVNLGIMDNKGYEVDLSYHGKIKKFSFFADAQVSYAVNKIVFMDEGVSRYPWLGSTGKPAGATFGYTALGLYQSLYELYNSAHITSAIPLSNLNLGGIKLADLNNDGVIDQYDQGYLGTNQPPYTGGFTLGFSYKGFDVSTLFQGAFGNIITIQKGSIAYNTPDRVSVPYNLGRWTPATAATATFPVLGGSSSQNSLSSSYWFYKGDYVRWKNVEIGYKLPSDICKRLHLAAIRIYTNGYNLGLIYTALPVFIDPESISSTTNYLYPQEKVFNLGLQVSL